MLTTCTFYSILILIARRVNESFSIYDDKYHGNMSSWLELLF